MNDTLYLNNNRISNFEKLFTKKEFYLVRSSNISYF